MSKKEMTERFLEFIKKWNYEDFNAFEKHFNRLMSMKGREQLTVENEALKDSIAVILAQKKNYAKSCDQKDQQIHELQEQLKNAIVLPIKVGDYVQEIRYKEIYIYEYLGNLKFKCLTHKQGYHCDYILVGQLVTKDIHDLKVLSKEEVKKKLKELKESE